MTLLRFCLLFVTFTVMFCFVGPMVAMTARWVSDIVNTPVPYALAPFCVGLLFRRYWVSAAAGLVVCAGMVVLFYIGDDLSSQHAFNSSGFTTYLPQALIVGPIFGLLGGIVGHLQLRLRLVLCLAFCVVVILFQIRDIWESNAIVPEHRNLWDDASLLINAVVWSLWAVGGAWVRKSSDEPAESRA